jgi:hypothetical protein
MTRTWDESLTSAAQLFLAGNLERYGTRLSGAHRAAVYQLCATLTDFATGRTSGRRVFALPTGTGKTASIIAWLTILYRLGKPAEHVSVAVSASQVRALCAIKRALLSNGVPEEVIGLKHSLSDADLLPSTGDDDRRFMLITHARVRGGTNHRLFAQHRGKPRALLIYDESLFKSDCIAIGARDARLGHGVVAGLIEGKAGSAEAMAYLERCRELVESSVRSAQAAPAEAITVTLPELSELEQRGFSELIRSETRKDAERRMAEPQLELIALSGGTLRVAVTPQGEGVLFHRVAVPAELDRVLVLDASYPIRALLTLDPTLSPASRFSDAPIKRFDNLTVRQMFSFGGRYSVERSFKEAKEKRAVSREVVEVVKRIPSEQAVLVFTFKSHRDYIKRTLLDDMRAAGVDTEATVGGKPRISVLTWGNETSLNDFVHADHVILAGVLHRSLLDVASTVVGQLDDRDADLNGKRLQDMVDSEIAHCVYQAASRGRCRETVYGQAKAMTLHVIHSRPLQKRLERVLPGARYQVWEPSFATASDRETAPLAIAVQEHLRQLPETVRKVSTRQLKKALDVPAKLDRTFSRAVALIGRLGSEWTLEGRSMVRVDGGFHGFGAET